MLPCTFSSIVSFDLWSFVASTLQVTTRTIIRRKPPFKSFDFPLHLFPCSPSASTPFPTINDFKYRHYSNFNCRPASLRITLRQSPCSLTTHTAAISSNRLSYPYAVWLSLHTRFLCCPWPTVK